MSKIIYYVACSLVGYIAGVDDDISQFFPSGEGVDQYLSDLQSFETVIMGRRTYEFGYQFGLKPGEPAYPHMQHYIFSETLRFDSASDSVHVVELSKPKILEIRNSSTTDVYLCGGGEFAGWLLDHDQIDELWIKLNPILIGDGTTLFGSSKKQTNWVLFDSKTFDEGLQINKYRKNLIQLFPMQYSL